VEKRPGAGRPCIPQPGDEQRSRWLLSRIRARPGSACVQRDQVPWLSMVLSVCFKGIYEASAGKNSYTGRNAVAWLLLPICQGREQCQSAGWRAFALAYLCDDGLPTGRDYPAVAERAWLQREGRAVLGLKIFSRIRTWPEPARYFDRGRVFATNVSVGCTCFPAEHQRIRGSRQLSGCESSQPV